MGNGGRYAVHMCFSPLCIHSILYRKRHDKISGSSGLSCDIIKPPVQIDGATWVLSGTKQMAVESNCWGIMLERVVFCQKGLLCNGEFSVSHTGRTVSLSLDHTAGNVLWFSHSVSPGGGNSSAPRRGSKTSSGSDPVGDAGKHQVVGGLPQSVPEKGSGRGRFLLKAYPYCTVNNMGVFAAVGFRQNELHTHSLPLTNLNHWYKHFFHK